MNEVTDPRIEAIIEANTALDPDADTQDVRPSQSQMYEVPDPRIEAIIEANTALDPDADTQDVKPRQNQKIKLLKIMEILREQSDQENPMTTSQLVNALIAQGVSSERRTLAKDIAALNEYGYEIVSVNVGRERGYYTNGQGRKAAGAQTFDIPEVSAVLEFKKGMTDVILEKFGKDTPMLEVDEGVLIATVTVPSDPAVWSWLFQNVAKCRFALK